MKAKQFDFTKPHEFVYHHDNPFAGPPMRMCVCRLAENNPIHNSTPTPKPSAVKIHKYAESKMFDFTCKVCGQLDEDPIHSPTPKPGEEWEKRFDKRFGFKQELNPDGTGYFDFNGHPLDIKAFIASELAHQRAELRQKVLDLAERDYKYRFGPEGYGAHSPEYLHEHAVYRQALAEVLSLLNPEDLRK